MTSASIRETTPPAAENNDTSPPTRNRNGVGIQTGNTAKIGDVSRTIELTDEILPVDLEANGLAGGYWSAIKNQAGGILDLQRATRMLHDHGQVQVQLTAYGFENGF